MKREREIAPMWEGKNKNIPFHTKSKRYPFTWLLMRTSDNSHSISGPLFSIVRWRLWIRSGIQGCYKRFFLHWRDETLKHLRPCPRRPGTAVHACNRSTWKADEGGTWVQSQLLLCREPRVARLGYARACQNPEDLGSVPSTCIITFEWDVPHTPWA